MLALLVFGARATNLRAQRTAQPERPTVATHAGTVAPGYLEIEAGIERDRIGGTTSYVAPTVFKFGVGSHAQMSLFGGLSSPAQSGTGVGDFGIGLKWRLVDDAPVLADFAVFPSAKFPTGSVDRGRGTGTTDVGLLLISSRQIGTVAIDLNVGFTHRSGDGTNAPTNATLWTASFGGPAAGAVGWVAEVFGYPATTGPAGQSSTVAVLAGPTYTVRPWLVLDIGIISALAGPQPNAFYMGLTYNAGRVW